MGLKIGILGTGRFTPGFIRFFRDHPGVDELTLCDIVPERMIEIGKQFGIERFAESLDELCAMNLDAIAVFTQPWLHAPQAVQAMEAGSCWK